MSNLNFKADINPNKVAFVLLKKLKETKVNLSPQRLILKKMKQVKTSVSRSAYYKYLEQDFGQRAVENSHLLETIYVVYEKSRCT